MTPASAPPHLGTPGVKILNRIAKQAARQHGFDYLDFFAMRYGMPHDGDGHHCQAGYFWMPAAFQERHAGLVGEHASRASATLADRGLLDRETTQVQLSPENPSWSCWSGAQAILHAASL